MIYVGTSLKTPAGSANDPSLIDPSKSVSTHGDYTQGEMTYWPSYSEISGTARRAYLNWLAGGRSDPAVDIGYVFLFFYGLERRAILDAAKDPAAQADRPDIAAELRRLLGIYGDASASFRRYASELLDWVSLSEFPERLYEIKNIPSFVRTYELPLHLRLALGQTAVDGVPVPVHLALAWVRLHSGIWLRTPATRCKDEFNALFAAHYAKSCGAGMVLRKNRTKLKMVYRPASAGFRGVNDVSLTFGDVPDVTVLTAPVKKLQGIAEAATNELDAYSRFIGRNPDARDALEGLLQLPETLWPESARKAVQALKARIGDGLAVMTFQELLSTLQAKTAFTKDRTQCLARALASMGIGLEPDVLGGARMPKPEEPIVLFATPASEMSSQETPAYQAALLTLDLAAAVAIADGDFSASEMGHLRLQVQSWVHMAPVHRSRLLAHLRLLIAAPVTLASLRKKLEPLPIAAKESIAAFMSTFAQADGAVSPAEMKMLEKVYKVLGLDAKKVFSDVHAAAGNTPATGQSSVGSEQAGFQLDRARIAALQEDTAKVSALLAGIFKEDESASVATMELEADVEAASESSVMPAGLLGLDELHSALARTLLSRARWRRGELLDVATDLDLMLDGALERINEASFDVHDISFTEGDDPIDVNAEILEKIEA